MMLAPGAHHTCCRLGFPARALETVFPSGGLAATQTHRPGPWTKATAGTSATNMDGCEETHLISQDPCPMYPALRGERFPSQDPGRWTRGPPRACGSCTPGLSSVPASQHPAPGTAARPAGLHIRSSGCWRTKLTGASLGMALQLQATCDSACPSPSWCPWLGSLLGWAAPSDAERQLEGPPAAAGSGHCSPEDHSCPPAQPALRARRTDCGQGAPPPLPFLSKTPNTNADRLGAT